ncbi:head GIN domain-containing protein [Sediminibacterium sp. TEGAF015]|uniref:head GIN domain-containing protein n=1 Tax=Sediminibacterium sp. TEGAF015 TaxID=575378 RepID=UPI0022056337|nr:head GIN domain-containing protein [Sediminibacterium sp. TEGAF015]BDQ10993.1 hypothetical protein TEGAF0_02100 [Sediminibacterium sp. TEGAF015]
MKKILFLLSFTFAGLAVMAQKTVNEPHVEKRSVKSFHAVEVSSGIKLILTQGDKEELAVAAGDPAYLEYIETTVKDGVLKITRNQDWQFWKQWKNWKVTVYLSFKDLNKINASSGALVSGTNLDFDKLTVRMSSGALAELSGKADDISVDASSGAMFKGYELSAKTCDAESSSGGSVQVQVSKEMIARASSGGSIRYKGEGNIRDIKVGSGGSVKRL